MKRSEALALVKGFLTGYEDPGFAEEREDDADALLSMLESNGVPPPASESSLKSMAMDDLTPEWDKE